MEEKIYLKKIKTGSTVTYFSTDLVDDGEFDLYPAYLKLDPINGAPVSVHLMSDTEKWIRDTDNSFKLFDETQPHLTGSCFFNSTSQQVSASGQEIVRDKFAQRMQEITPTSQSFVMFEPKLLDDFYAHVKLERSFDVLNTLNIYNRPLQEWQVQEAQTGVVFGRLVALQEILDENGNKVKIPLRNVPIGVFNPSEEYPTIASRNEDGDRIRLNLRENAFVTANYFNKASHDVDVQLEFSAEVTSGATQTPEQFKYVTITNENGEFIIYDVPTGSQVLFFEVDLLKQGLTKDEVTLNFFPYPTDESPNVDRVPHFFFRQIPVDVFPAWGDFQTGYTEINISANLDMRKWATYYVPPVVFGPDGFKVNSLEILNISTAPISLEVRDMTRKDEGSGAFKSTGIRMVQIPQIAEKDKSQTLAWDQEFAIVKNKATFREHGWQAIKLPANLYDPLGYRTDNDGIPRETVYHQGVWLAAYQLKLWFTDEENYYRTTGMARQWYSATGMHSRDHFHMNYNINNPRWNEAVTSSAQIAGNSSPNTQLLEFPYERSWTIDYPEPYKIPKRPTEKNYTSGDRTYRPVVSIYNNVVLESPYYKDGDLIGENLGNPIANDIDAGGLGLNLKANPNTGEIDTFTNNNFSTKVTQNFVYKYGNSHWSDAYASGYAQGSTMDGQYSSNVVNAEKYQRVECGYGYTLWPGGMYRVGHLPMQADAAFFSDIQIAATNSNNLTNNNVSTSAGFNTTHLPNDAGYSHSDFVSVVDYYDLSFYVDVLNRPYQDFALRLDPGVSATAQHDKLSLYRVIDPNNLAEPIPVIQTQRVTLNMGEIWVQRGNRPGRAQCKHETTNNTNQDSFFSWNDARFRSHGGAVNAILLLKNKGSYRVKVELNGIQFATLNKGEEIEIMDSDANLAYLSIGLTTNAGYDYSTNTYETCNVGIELNNIEYFNAGNGNFAGRKNHTFSNVLFQGNSAYFAYTKTGHIKVRSKWTLSNGYVYDCSGGSTQALETIYTNGMMCENCGNTYWQWTSWTTTPIVTECSADGIPFVRV